MIPNQTHCSVKRVFEEASARSKWVKCQDTQERPQSGGIEPSQGTRYE